MKINKKNIIPILVALAFYLLSYQIPKHIVPLDRVHFLYFPIDQKIPLICESSIIYLGAFIQWIIAAIVLLKQDTKTTYRITSAIIICSIIGFIIFMIYPTGTIRPEINGNNLFEKYMKMTYFFDNIIGAMPSYHCFMSVISIYVLKMSKGISNSARIINAVYSLLVFVSTLTTKQHFIIDIPTGILLAIVGMKLSKNLNFEKCFDKLNNKLKING